MIILSNNTDTLKDILKLKDSEFMFIIYENMDRYMGGGISSKVIGYVKTESEANEVCEKLKAKVKAKNKTNTMAYWYYSFELVKYIDINNIE